MFSISGKIRRKNVAADNHACESIAMAGVITPTKGQINNLSV